MDIPKDLKLVVFDFDGTIFHLDVDWDVLRQQLGVSDDEKIGDIIWRLIDENDGRVEQITDAELKSIGKRRMDAEITKAFNYLLSRGFHVAVFTRNSRKAVEAVLRNSRIDGPVLIVGREDVAQQKPSPEGLQNLMKQYTVNIDEVIVIGDTIHDVEAARSAGAKVVIVENERLAYRPEGADYYIENIRQLFKASKDFVW